MHGSDDLRGHDWWLGADDRHLGDAVLAQDVDGFANRLGGVRVHEGRQRPGGAFAGHHVADGLPAVGLQKAVVGHPLVVEDFRQVALARVGQQHHDHRVRAGLGGDLQRGNDGHAAGAADQQPLLAGQPAGHGERVAVVDRDDPVGDGGVVGLRPEVLADTLDEVRPAVSAGVDRPDRVGPDHLDPALGNLFEVATDTTDRAAGAHAGHEVRDLPIGLRPHLRAGGLVVGPRVGRVGVLVRFPGTGQLAGQPV